MTDDDLSGVFDVLRVEPSDGFTYLYLANEADDRLFIPIFGYPGFSEGDRIKFEMGPSGRRAVAA